MTSKLRLLDLALVAVLALLAGQLRQEWIRMHAREQAQRRITIQPEGVAGLLPLRKVEPVAAASYAEVATKDLFSPDRNPDVIIDPPKPVPEKPPPPFPVAHGVMLWEGVPPTVVLSERAGGAQKGYHPGEKIGQWTLVSVDESFVGLEWNGKEFKKRIDELLDRTPLVAEAPIPNKPPAPSAPLGPQQSLSSNTTSGPGQPTGSGFAACVPGDSSPDGAVVGGMKKVMGQTPFGSSCHWEQVK